jgi:uncharacterized protein YoxC
MTEVLPSDSHLSAIRRIGTQPIALAAAAFVVLVIGIGTVVAWRSYSGVSPETSQVTAASRTQAKLVQGNAELVEKTKGLEDSQQQAIDQLQIVQDQLQAVHQLLASQQTETRRLAQQVSVLNSTIDGLRESFASMPPPSEAASPPTARKKPAVSRRASVLKRKPARVASHGASKPRR